MKQAVLAAACLALLGACATGTAGSVPPVGASEQELEPGRFQVTYRGPSRMPEAEVRDRALLRAAELSLARGFDWFTVVERFDDIAPPTRPRFSIGVGSASFGRRSALGVGGSTAFGGEESFVAGLEIVAHRGVRPAGADVYGARAIVDTLRQRISPP